MTFSSLCLDDRSISLIGAGGHARVVASSAGRSGLLLHAVFDADPNRVGRAFNGVIVEADGEAIAGAVHVAIGSNRIRRDVVGAHPDTRWTSVVDPSARLADGVEVEDGVLIGLGACVQVGARLGRHAIVNTGAIVEHDCVVGPFAHIGPGAVLAGEVRVGEGALVGAGVVILPGLTLGDWAIVGAGSVVTRSVGRGETVVGSPARVVESGPE